MERTDAIRALSRATFTLVTEAQQAMSKAFDAPRVGVLRVVATEGPLRPSAIGERLDMAPSSVTRHVQALEDATHLEVRPDPKDARTCLIEVTAAGEAELAQLESIGKTTFTEVVADWSTEELRTLTELVRRLTTDWADRGPASRRKARPPTTPRWRYRPTGQQGAHDD